MNAGFQLQPTLGVKERKMDSRPKGFCFKLQGILQMSLICILKDWLRDKRFWEESKNILLHKVMSHVLTRKKNYMRFSHFPSILSCSFGAQL